MFLNYFFFLQQLVLDPVFIPCFKWHDLFCTNDVQEVRMGEEPGQYSRLAGVELCGNCFTLHFFPENGDGGFRLLPTQSWSLLSCLMLNGSSPRCSIALYTVLSLLSLTLPGKEQSPAPPNSISLWTLLCCSNRGLLFCLQGELLLCRTGAGSVEIQGWGGVAT